MEKMDVIGEAFSRYLTGFALSKAILEDYTKVVAKLEGVGEEEVKNRVWQRANEIYKDTVEKQRSQIEETKQS